MNKERIRELALANGFKLKEQPDGVMDLNPYVFEFSAALERVATAELKAQVEQLRAYAEFWMNTAEDCALAGTKTEACEIFEEAILNKKPEQCLAEIEAQAGRDGYLQGCVDYGNRLIIAKDEECTEFYKKSAEAYANQIRQAAKGDK